MSLEFSGGRELDQALQELGEATGKSTRGKAAMRRALTKALEPFAERWREGVTKRTGHLETTIVVGTRLNKRQTRMSRAEKSHVEVHAGTVDPAGMWEEFGLAHNPGNPAGREALDATQSEILDILGKEAWSEIEKVAKRLERKAARARRR